MPLSLAIKLRHFWWKKVLISFKNKSYWPQNFELFLDLFCVGEFICLLGKHVLRWPSGFHFSCWIDVTIMKQRTLWMKVCLIVHVSEVIFIYFLFWTYTEGNYDRIDTLYFTLWVSFVLSSMASNCWVVSLLNEIL